MRPGQPKDRGTRFLGCATIDCTQILVTDATEDFIVDFSFIARCPKCGKVVHKRAGERAPYLAESEGG
jgi:ssDNA-binding Zn-finger/Zn-ribbon topoisomerase 1